MCRVMGKAIRTLLFMFPLLGSAATAWTQNRSDPVSSRALWFMRETAMTADGRLTFLNKPWWPRAKKLQEGQSFTFDLNHDGRPDTLVERKGGHIIEAIDKSGQAANILNKSDTSYVVSYAGTGIVDRMVVYTDNDHDGKADEMEIRYYKDGYLRYAWFGENYDHDGAEIFHLTNWEYDFQQLLSKFRGNVMIYINKYDPVGQRWLPFSECPFAFWDPNHDGLGETVLRVSAAPLDSNSGSDLDYANNYDHTSESRDIAIDKIGNMNVRLSYNIDPEPRKDPLIQPHYNFGFTLVGRQPYNYANMAYTNPRRLPPQTVVRVPWDSGVQVSLNYPAQQTGFSWDEAHSVYRWEGQFWIYERELLPNTGGPTMRWNMRREYSAITSTQRKLYFSEVDKRYHLYGASEGWLEVGHLIDDQKDLEIRYFDSDHDGIFDTWQVLEPDNPLPVRVTRVMKPQATPIALDRNSLLAEYNGTVLPQAIRQDEELIVELKKLAVSPRGALYEQAAQQATIAERRRYCLDVARELYFLAGRNALYTLRASGDYPGPAFTAPGVTAVVSLERGPINGQYTLGDTLTYWKLAKQVEEFVNDYGEGLLGEAARDLDEIMAVPAFVSTSR